MNIEEYRDMTNNDVNLPEYYFEYGESRLSPGTTFANLKDFHLIYCNKRFIGPRKNAFGVAQHKKTGEKFGLRVVNTGTKNCSFKDAKIYEISVKYIDKENVDVKLVAAHKKYRPILCEDDFNDIEQVLGVPGKTVEETVDFITEQDVKEWEDVEYVEYEYDGYYKYVKTKVTRETPIEIEREVRLSGYKVWEKGDYTITITGNTNAESISIRQKYEFEPLSAFNLAMRRLKHGFLVARCVFCFTSVLSLLGLAGLLWNGSELIESISAICLLLGWFSTLFACPGQLLKVCKNIIGVFFMIGGTIFWLLGLVTALAGIAVSIALCLFGASVVAIPYYFTTLKKEVDIALLDVE